MRARLTGLRKATKRLASGQVAVYAYAFTGGPLVARGQGRGLAEANRALEAALGKKDALAAIEAARKPVRPRESRDYVRGLITAFRASPEWNRLGQSSKTAYSHYLDAFDAEFGDWRVSLFTLPGTKIDLLDWRDEWADRPRAADYAMQSVGRLFKWARGRGLTDAKPTEDVERLHRSNRADILWSDDDIAKILSHAGKEVGWAIRLAAETGLRLGDLTRLSWGAVGAEGIVWRTGKRNRQAVIPLTPNARRLLAEIPRRATVVLTNTRGRPWTPDGLKSMIGEAKTAAGITGLHFHDIRGTAATRLRISGADVHTLATILGWSERSVEELLTKYVSGDAVALDLQKRMNQKPALQTGCKPDAGLKG